MTVADYLPRGHVAYARVMNPMRNEADDDGQPLAWSTFATAPSEVDATTKWTDLIDNEPDVDLKVGTIEPAVTPLQTPSITAHLKQLWANCGQIRQIRRNVPLSRFQKP